MAASPQVAALDEGIDDLKRQVKAQTQIVTDLIGVDGNTMQAEQVLWGLMDVLSNLRHHRFDFQNPDQATAS